MKENFYEFIINECPIGYAYYRIMLDTNNNPSDYEILDVNSKFEEYIGLKKKSLLGKKITEIFPDISKAEKDLIKIYGDIALNGGNREIEWFSNILKGLYNIKISSPKKNYFITYVTDIGDTEYDSQSFEDMNEKYKLLFENASESIVIIQDEKIQMFNPMLEKLTGYTKEELDTSYALYFIHPKDKEKAKNNHHTRLENKTFKSKQVYRLIRKDKKVIWIETNGVKIKWNGRPAVLNFIIDITESKKAEDALKKSEEKYRLLTENTSDVIWIFNIHRNKFTYVSPSMYYLTGYKAEDVVNKTLENSISPKSLAIFKDTVEKNMKEFIKRPNSNKHYIMEIQLFGKNKSPIWTEVSINFRYNDKREIEILGVSRNIEERKKSEKEVTYLSYNDQLTGLYNRRFYEEKLKKLDREENLPLTLVMADLNGLKLTNDAFGHLVGDKLLKRFSKILKEKFRENDIIARTGGDEFVILLPKTSCEKAEKIVHRIKKSISKEKINNIVLSVSFGWATKTSVNQSVEKIYTQAEDNMYYKKLLESTSMKNQTIKLIIESLYRNNNIEQEHCERVSKLCKKMGIVLGLDSNKVEDLRLLGLLHDIGKIGVNERVLSKSEKLNRGEWLEIKRHPEIGYKILKSVNEFSHIAEYVLCHHERVDGKGYPRNLKGDEIPLQAKILSVVEAYDIMTSGYHYKLRLSEKQAINELKMNSNTQFDPKVTEVFIKEILSKK